MAHWMLRSDGGCWVIMIVTTFFRIVSNENLKTCDIVAADIANSAKQMWDSFHSLMLGAPPLKLSRGLQGSTFLLGHRKEASGIRPRPQIANAAMVIPQAVALLEDRSNYQVKLEVSWRCDDFLLPKVRWDEAKKRLKIGQAQARRLRRAIGPDWVSHLCQGRMLIRIEQWCRPLASAGGRHFRIREIGKSRLVKYHNLARCIKNPSTNDMKFLISTDS